MITPLYHNKCDHGDEAAMTGLDGIDRLLLRGFGIPMQKYWDAHVRRPLVGQVSFWITPGPCRGRSSLVQQLSQWISKGLARIDRCASRKREGSKTTSIRS